MNMLVRALCAFLNMTLAVLAFPVSLTCRRSKHVLYMRQNPTIDTSILGKYEKRLETLNRRLNDAAIPDFREFVNNIAVHRQPTQILQLNVGLFCNMACSHCHVDASPVRTEMMSMDTAKQCIDLLDKFPSITTLDLTGGAPELNRCFRFLVEEGRKRNKRVIDRCNLTVLFEPGQENLLEFLKSNQVEIVASLPCYSKENVDKQRGDGTFGKSIIALQLLNAAGYGAPESGLKLDLVYNPGDAFLPASQSLLEARYKQQLNEDFGIIFNNLYTITNMPIKRFADFLMVSGKLEDYMNLLVNSFNPSAVNGIMCRNTLSINWEGKLFDCDFNQQLGMGITAEANGDIITVNDTQILSNLKNVSILFDRHCYGCTAGSGSSCQGSTIE